MSDIIKLLPDSVANQIAAGEVVQRPASVVKELLENSIDAGATDIKLIVKDAGRTLIQVTDNGKGMSENDARMSFERHATSKIKNASDLWALTTMGFRGEALASIASVARVELKTRSADTPLATEIFMEGSKLETQQQCQAPIGTTIIVKNLFFNTPARRNFLKSDNVEKAHVFNEFIRIALAHPQVAFSYYHNNQLVTQAGTGNLGSRIINLFGSHYKPRLIPIEEDTQIVSIQGYILKPEYAKKRKSDQYFFVNNRFIKSPYLNHAVENGFEELIPDDSYPAFFLFLQIDPAQIDVNVHPTKTEIKFQDEKLIYQIIKAAVKRSLGKFNIVPSLDFERETAFDDVRFDKTKPVVAPTIDVNPNFNPFEQEKSTGSSGKNLTSRANPRQWEKLFPQPGRAASQESQQQNMEPGHYTSQQTIINPDWQESQDKPQGKKFMHLQGRYILTSIKSGLMIIDQQRAHERILFEKHLKMLENRKVASQTLLFPEQIKLTEPDADLLREIRTEIASLGFDISDYSHNSYMINAVPADLADNENLQWIMESILENFKKNNATIKLDTRVNLARSLAKSLSVKTGKPLTTEEMNALTDELFSCEMPYQTPSGKPTLNMLGMDEIGDKFK
ncbi:MAG: DNA mismatch repair endonuclease MutL [Bacteroidetes bacterium]|nr:MAG: DNA mismatch repair endonuclease MutL [Bacteroidota bacterium]